MLILPKNLDNRCAIVSGQSRNKMFRGISSNIFQIVRVGLIIISIVRVTWKARGIVPRHCSTNRFAGEWIRRNYRYYLRSSRFFFDPQPLAFIRSNILRTFFVDLPDDLANYYRADHGRFSVIRLLQSMYVR